MIPFEQRLKTIILKHEQKRNFPYLDTKGNITIGIGYNLSSRGLKDEWINNQYDEDVNYFYRKLDSDFPWFKNLSEARKIVLIDMCFMGYKKFLTFKKMLSALERGDYLKAAEEILNSDWAKEVKGRAQEDYDLMVRGEFPWGYLMQSGSEAHSQSQSRP